MQFTDVWYCALLTITMAATCIQANAKFNEVGEKSIDKRMSRKSTTVLVDSPRAEKMFQNPKLIYRRLSKKRYVPPKAKYGPPRPKYGPSISYRKPGKKYRTKHTPKRNLSGGYKKRAPKPKYGLPKRPTMKPVYGPPKIQRPHFQYDNIGFGEPPNTYKHRPQKPNEFSRPHTDSQSNQDFDNNFSTKPFDGDFSSKPNYDGLDFSSPASYSNDFLKPFGDDHLNKPTFSDLHEHNQGYGEPPVDSYGAPIKPNLRDLTFPNKQSFNNPATNFDEDYHFGSDLQSWKNFKDENQDNNFAYSKKHVELSEPESTEVYVTPVPKEQNEELHLNSYSDIYNYRQTKDKKKKKKNTSYFENVKILNQPWTGHNAKRESDEEIIVGGQYAEPPARYIPKFMPSAPMKNHDDNVFSPPLNFPDHDAVSSATISSYVNYKNSNMAFSPQNLNDVFSIVD